MLNFYFLLLLLIISCASNEPGPDEIPEHLQWIFDVFDSDEPATFQDGEEISPAFRFGNSIIVNEEDLTNAFQHIIENNDESELLEALQNAVDSENINRRLNSTMALFLFRDEPELRLNFLLDSLESSSDDEKYAASRLLIHYFEPENYHELFTINVMFPGYPPVGKILERDESDEEYVQILLDRLSLTEDRLTRKTIVEMLAYFTDNQGVLEALLELATDESVINDGTALAARDSILGTLGTGVSGSITDFDPQLENKILELLENPNDYLREVGLCALRLLASNKDHMNLIVQSTQDTESGVRFQAYLTLGEISQPEDLIPMLINALEDQSTIVKFGAISLLGEYAADSTDALPELWKIYYKEGNWLSEAANDAIRNIEGMSNIEVIEDTTD